MAITSYEYRPDRLKLYLRILQKVKVQKFAKWIMQENCKIKVLNISLNLDNNLYCFPEFVSLL